jgi:hypothetical protein
VLAAQQAAKAKIDQDRKRSRPADLEDEYTDQLPSKRRKFDSEHRDRKRSQSFSSSSDADSSKSSQSDVDDAQNEKMTSQDPADVANKYWNEQSARVVSKERLNQQILDLSKEIYLRLPKARDEIFAAEIDWEALRAHNVFELKAKPWITKKIKEYLGVEEFAMISLVMGHISSTTVPISIESLLAKVGDILDEVAEQFVIKLW